MRILVVEDDLEAQRYLVQGLKESGHVVDDAADGDLGLSLALSRPYDVAIIDRMLPKMDGLGVVAEMREHGNTTPVLFLSALSEVDDRVKGLKAGGDDYLTKPYAFVELLARVDALMRRRSPVTVKTQLSVGDLHLDLLTRAAKRGDQAIDLQPREFRLLEYLMRHAGQVVTRTMLLESVWEYHFDPQTNVIDVHISRLRAKIDKGFDTPLLHTIRGAGYMIPCAMNGAGAVIKNSLRLLRTQAFRIVLVYVLLFALSVTALLFFTYWNTRRTIDDADRPDHRGRHPRPARAISHPAAEYTRAGRERDKWPYAASRPGALSSRRFAHRVLAGSFDSWPSITPDPDNFVEFDYERRTNGVPETRRARGRVFPISDPAGDFYLLVAVDVHDRDITQHMFTTTLPWTVALILLFGLLGGLLMSQNMLRRLDAINRTSGEIIAGDLTRRVPVSRAHDEFDALAENLNRMLDRIERLMKGLREVTDSVAHDLRTPLNRLRQRLEQSQARLGAAGSDTSDIERAIAETDQLIGTFNALLLIAETDAGTGRGAMTPLDLASVAADVSELYEPLAEEKNVSLSLIRPAPACIPARPSKAIAA